MALRSLPFWAVFAMWGGFFASTWMPAYAQLKDSVPSHVVATAMGILNLFFWLGGAVFQQVSGMILAGFPRPDGHSIILVLLSTERRRARSTRT